MALDYELEDDGTTYDWAAAGRAAQPKAMTPAYTGVGDELAVPDLVCGVAEPAGLGTVESADAAPHHPLQP